jgi:carbonyl reductase 1
MGSRNMERGQKAIDELPEGCKGNIELVQIDISDDASIAAAASTMQGKLGDEKLFALVNNAGMGGEDYDLLMKTNLYG